VGLGFRIEFIEQKLKLSWFLGCEKICNNLSKELGQTFVVLLASFSLLVRQR
jgi:hypothetical protein